MAGPEGIPHGKWVISHGIKNRIVGSEWDYNGMIIYIYIYIAGWWFGTMEFYDFPYIGNVIIPIDEVIFFRGVGQPPAR